ncbi:MAG: DUF72 domain-containing protein [Maioricimonas sp. JB045]
MDGTYHLGCPVWACEHWRGELFTAKASRREWLEQYAAVFSTVEVNSTFYALPDRATVQRWADSTPAGFRFALKLPRVVSHDRRLQNVVGEMRAFLSLLDVLRQAERSGPAFLQLPPDFSSREWPSLERFIMALPREFQFAVEVRHLDWFDRGEWEGRLNTLLAERGIDRCYLDSRALYAKPPTDEHERISQTRKPKSPYRTDLTGLSPLVRIVGRNCPDEVHPWWEEWAEVVAGWIRQGLTPYVFTHAPDDTFAPELGRLFHERLRQHLPEIAPMPIWPGERERRERPVQKTLF